MSCCVRENLPQRIATSSFFAYFCGFNIVKMAFLYLGYIFPKELLHRLFLRIRHVKMQSFVEGKFTPKNCNAVIFLFIDGFDFVKLPSCVGGNITQKNRNPVIFCLFFKTSTQLKRRLVLEKIYLRKLQKLFFLYILMDSTLQDVILCWRKFVKMSSCVRRKFTPKRIAIQFRDC